MFTPVHLERWYERINYTGDNFDDYYVAYWRPFKCSPLERSNYQHIKDHLKRCGAPKCDIVDATFSDEVLTYRYYILVHKDSDRALRMADMFMERIKRKGSLDPERELKVNASAVQLKWYKMLLKNKIQMCKETGLSIFTARQKNLDPLHPSYDTLVEFMSEVS